MAPSLHPSGPISVSLSSWFGSPFLFLSCLSLSVAISLSPRPPPTVSLSIRLCVLWLPLTSGMGQGRPPRIPLLASVLVHMGGSQVGSCWGGGGGRGACHGLMSHEPTSSDAGTQSNSLRGHTHPSLFFPRLLIPSWSQKTSAPSDFFFFLRFRYRFSYAGS